MSILDLLKQRREAGLVNPIEQWLQKKREEPTLEAGSLGPRKTEPQAQEDLVIKAAPKETTLGRVGGFLQRTFVEPVKEAVTGMTKKERDYAKGLGELAEEDPGVLTEREKKELGISREEGTEDIETWITQNTPQVEKKTTELSKLSDEIEKMEEDLMTRGVRIEAGEDYLIDGFNKDVEEFNKKIELFQEEYPAYEALIKQVEDKTEELGKLKEQKEGYVESQQARQPFSTSTFISSPTSLARATAAVGRYLEVIPRAIIQTLATADESLKAAGLMDISNQTISGIINKIDPRALGVERPLWVGLMGKIDDEKKKLPKPKDKKEQALQAIGLFTGVVLPDILDVWIASAWAKTMVALSLKATGYDPLRDYATQSLGLPKGSYVISPEQTAKGRIVYEEAIRRGMTEDVAMNEAKKVISQALKKEGLNIAPKDILMPGEVWNKASEAFGKAGTIQDQSRVLRSMQILADQTAEGQRVVSPLIRKFEDAIVKIIKPIGQYGGIRPVGYEQMLGLPGWTGSGKIGLAIEPIINKEMQTKAGELAAKGLGVDAIVKQLAGIPQDIAQTIAAQAVKSVVGGIAQKPKDTTALYKNLTQKEVNDSGYLIRGSGQSGSYQDIFSDRAGGTWATNDLEYAKRYGEFLDYVEKPKNVIKFDHIHDAFGKYVGEDIGAESATKEDYLKLKNALLKEGYDALEVGVETLGEFPVSTRETWLLDDDTQLINPMEAGAAVGGGRDYLYHGTSMGNIDSIATDGLSAGKSSALTDKRISFTESPDLAEKFASISGEDPVLIRVKRDAVEDLNKDINHENSFRTTSDVPAKDLEFRDTDGMWKPLTKKLDVPTDDMATSISGAQAQGKSFDGWLDEQRAVYRTEEADSVYKNKSVWGDGKYFGIDENQVKELTENPHTGKSTGGVVDKYVVPPDVKIKEIDLGWDAMDPDDFEKFPKGNDLKEQMISEGYDGVILLTEGDLNLGGDQFIMYRNADKIKTVSQLKAEWDMVAVGQKPPIKPPTLRSMGITPEPSPFRRKREMTLLKEKIKNIARGAREGSIATRKQIKEAQKEVTDAIKGSGMNLNDQAKFISRIRQVQTPDQLARELPNITRRISRLQEARAVREIKAQVARELKTKFVITDKSGVKKGRATIEAQDKIAQIKQDLKLTQDQAKDELMRLTSAEGDTMEVIDPNRIRVLTASAGDANSQAWQDLLDDIRSIKSNGMTMFEMKRSNELAKEQMERDRWTAAIAPKGLQPGTGMAPVAIPGKSTNVIDRALKGIGSAEDYALTTQHLLDKLERGHVVPGELYLNGPITQFYTRGVTKADNDQFEAVEKLHQEVNDKLAELWGVRMGSRKHRIAMIDHLQNKIDLGTFMDFEGREFPLTMTKDQIMYHWGQTQNPSVMPTYIGMGWTEEMISALGKNLTPAEKDFVWWVGDGDNGFFTRARTGLIDGINMDPIYENMYGTRLGKVEGIYLPLARDIDMPAHVQMINDFVQMNSTKISSIKSRTQNIQPVKMDTGLMSQMEKYIQETAHWKTHAEFVNKFRRLFSGDVREAVRQNFRDAGKILEEVDRQMNHLAANGVKDARTYEVIDGLMGSAYTGFIGASPSSATKQLVSSIAWAGELDNPVKLITDGANFWMNPIETGRFLFDNSAGLRGRISQLTFEREAARAVRSGDAAVLASRGASLRRHTMILTRIGDVAAIFPGMWAKYLEELEKGIGFKIQRGVKEIKNIIKQYPEAHDNAILSAQETYERTQQTGLLGKMSSIRRSGSWGKMWTFAMSAPEAQFNQSISTLRAMGTFGDPKRIPYGKGLLRLLIYLVMIPAMLQVISDGFKVRPHRIAASVGASALTGGISNYPVFFGSLIQNAVRGIMGLPVFDVGTPAPVSIMEELSTIPKSVMDMIFEKMTAEEYFTEIADIASTLATAKGFPAKPLERIITGNIDPEGNILRRFGWSEWALEEQGVEAKPNRDPFGRPMGWTDKISMNRFLRGKDDPVTNELRRLDIDLSYPSKTVSGYELTPEEYDLFLQDSGPRVYNKLSEEFGTERYQGYSDNNKEAMIDRIMSRYREESRKTLFEHYYRASLEEKQLMREGMTPEEATKEAMEKLNITPENSEAYVRSKVEERKIDLQQN